MRHLSIPMLCFSILFAAGCSSGSDNSTEASVQADEPSSAVASGSSQFDLTEAEKEMARTAALAGDPTSAKRLADYYSFIELDTAQSVQWLRIAVRDGDPKTSQNLAYGLNTLGGLNNCNESLAILKNIRNRYPDPGFIDDSIRALEADFQLCVKHGRWPPNNSFKPRPLRGSA